MDAREAARRRRRQVKVKRVYDAPQASDGMRVLVDRLWPRDLLEGLRGNGPLTLLYGSRDTKHNHALVPRDALESGDARATRTKEPAA
jgi:uncharacterized protein YeaO (DUF488 family)